MRYLEYIIYKDKLASEMEALKPAIVSLGLAPAVAAVGAGVGGVARASEAWRGLNDEDLREAFIRGMLSGGFTSGGAMVGVAPSLYIANKYGMGVAVPIGAATTAVGGYLGNRRAAQLAERRFGPTTY